MKYNLWIHRCDLQFIGLSLLYGLAASRSFGPHLAGYFLNSIFDVLVAVLLFKLGEKAPIGMIKIQVVLLMIRTCRASRLDFSLNENRFFVIARLLRLHGFQREACLLLFTFLYIYEHDLVCLNLFTFRTIVRFRDYRHCCCLSQI